METRVITSKHNNPPSDIDIVGEKALDLYPEIFATYERLKNREGEIPEEVQSDDEAGSLGDYIKQIRGNIKSLEATRKEEKEPHLRMSRAVDGFFKRYVEPLQKIEDKAKKVQAEWVAKKQEEERIKREEEAEKKRLEAEAALEEARKREEELEAKRKAEEEKRKAEEAAAEAERQRIAEEQRKIEAEKKRLEDEKKAAKEKEERDKAERERLKKQEEELKAKEKEQKERQRELDRQQKELEAEQKKADREARKEERDINRTLEKAEKTERQAERIEKSADKAAQAGSRIRGYEGSMSSVRNEWTGELTSREQLDLEKLRQHIPEDALEKAIRSFVKAGGRELKGAHIYIENKVNVR